MLKALLQSGIYAAQLGVVVLEQFAVLVIVGGMGENGDGCHA